MIKDSIFSIIYISKLLSSELIFVDFLLKNNCPNKYGLFSIGFLKLSRFLGKFMVTANLNIGKLLDLIVIYKLEKKIGIANSFKHIRAIR